jgi:hypothetical protein
VCQLLTGECYCFPGFTNVNCALYTPPQAKVSAYAGDILKGTIDVDQSVHNYTGSVMNIGTMYTGAALGMCYMNFSNADNVLLTLSGDNADLDLYFGSLTHAALDGIGGQTIAHGGLTLGGGTKMHTERYHHTGGGLTIQNLGLHVSGGMTLSGLNNNFNSLYVGGGGVVATGGVTVFDAGIVVSGGITINSRINNQYAGLIVVQDGVTVKGGGGKIAAGGLQVSQDGVSVGAGGLISKKGISVKDTGLVVSGGLTINSIYVGNGNAISVPAGMTVNSGGVSVKGGLSILDSGLVLANTYLNAPVDNIRIAGGVTVNANGIAVTGGVTVQDSGVAVTAGISVNSNGLRITASGLFATGGITLTNSLVVTAGMTVLSGGIDILSGGMTVNAASNAGMYVNGDITVQNAGMLCKTCVTFIQGTGVGLQVTGSVTVYGSAGVVVQSGTVKVSSAVGTKITGTYSPPQLLLFSRSWIIWFMCALGGVTVKSTGLKVTGGVSLLTTGLSVSQGTTVMSGGVYLPDQLILVGTKGQLRSRLQKIFYPHFHRLGHRGKRNRRRRCEWRSICRYSWHKNWFSRSAPHWRRDG